MILMTPGRAQARQKARKNFPLAEWLPGDEPPCGLSVKKKRSA